MDIGQLMLSLAGEFRLRDARTLELKAGQIVRGVLLQMLTDSEALLSLEGVQVRARLQAPLPHGQTAWLQVLPSSAAGEIVLKPVDMPPSRASGGDLGQLLKSFGLEDSEANRRLLLLMQREGIEWSRANVRELARAVREAPAGADGRRPGAVARTAAYGRVDPRAAPGAVRASPGTAAYRAGAGGRPPPAGDVRSECGGFAAGFRGDGPARRPA